MEFAGIQHLIHQLMILKPLTPYGIAQFVSSITGLTASTTYHIRAYATNSVGTAYGADMSFTTLGEVPTVTTLAATNLAPASATLNGTVNANYLSTTVSFEYGLTTNYDQIATASQSPVTGNSLTNVSADISGLASGTTYHYRTKAVNSVGTEYGSDKIFSTTHIPTLNTTACFCPYNVHSFKRRKYYFRWRSSNNSKRSVLEYISKSNC